MGKSWSLFFQFSSIVFLAILKATSIGVLFWLDVSISEDFRTKHSDGDSGRLHPRRSDMLVMISYQN